MFLLSEFQNEKNVPFSNLRMHYDDLGNNIVLQIVLYCNHYQIATSRVSSDENSDFLLNTLPLNGFLSDTKQ